MPVRAPMRPPPSHAVIALSSSNLPEKLSGCVSWHGVASAAATTRRLLRSFAPPCPTPRPAVLWGATRALYPRPLVQVDLASREPCAVTNLRLHTPGGVGFLWLTHLRWGRAQAVRRGAVRLLHPVGPVLRQLVRRQGRPQVDDFLGMHPLLRVRRLVPRREQRRRRCGAERTGSRGCQPAYVDMCTRGG